MSTGQQPTNQAATPRTPRVILQTIHQGFDGQTCWVQVRGGVVPDGQGGAKLGVITMQPLHLKGSDLFEGLSMMLSRDGGATWEGPTEQPTLRRWPEANGIEACVCDFTPAWHTVTGMLLGTGHVARYKGDALMPPPRPREVSYAVFDEQRETWGNPKLLELPNDIWAHNVGSGCGQRVDLPDGDVLVPVYGHYRETFKTSGPFHAGVLRCSFDGHTLTVKEAGTPMSVPIQRGFCEPSLTTFEGRYYLTLRNDEAGYVTASDDGLHFDEPRQWTFDDGQRLGNYNTQQHWLRWGGGLYLVYTRKGLNNDHVFRHRGPLMMARVDPQRLCVLPETEQVVVPERGARLGNFAVAELSDECSWVTVSEWMQPIGCEKYGSDNSVYVAKVN